MIRAAGADAYLALRPATKRRIYGLLSPRTDPVAVLREIMDRAAAGPARCDDVDLAADVVSAALPPDSAALILCIHFGSCLTSADAARAAGHCEVH
jgi:hypothetical protein